MDHDYSEEIKDKKYADAYSEEKLFVKVARFAKKAGIKLIYLVLLLFYTLQKPSVPTKAKSIIIGALGYFLFPIDLIPDFIPVVGFSDDLAALTAAVVAVAMYVDAETKAKAKLKLYDWFGDYDHKEIEELHKVHGEEKENIIIDTVETDIIDTHFDV